MIYALREHNEHAIQELDEILRVFMIDITQMIVPEWAADFPVARWFIGYYNPYISWKYKYLEIGAFDTASTDEVYQRLCGMINTKFTIFSTKENHE
ncbi:hypothetical protein [Scytonema sp. NUACC26]|uniref:hypothetical protein n=1 Tax=Scytonema sp. NUACC26 TaxID=3140176 RepID=UPI0034DC3212